MTCEADSNVSLNKNAEEKVYRCQVDSWLVEKNTSSAGSHGIHHHLSTTIWGLYCHIGKFLHQVHGISRLSAWDQIGITSTFPSLASTAPNVGLKVLSAEMGIQALEAASMRFHVPRYSVPWCLFQVGWVGNIRSYSWLHVLYGCFVLHDLY